MISLLKKFIVVISLTLIAYFTQPKIIHIYHDKASTPALLQMVNYITQKESDIKIIMWDRFHTHIKNKEQFKNTFFVDRSRQIFELIDSYKQKYKRIKLVIHYNIHHTFLFDDLYSKFEKDIKVVHIYEDASTYMWWTDNMDWLLSVDSGIKKNLHMWGDIDAFCSTDNPLPRCDSIKEIRNRIRIIPVDFNRLQSELSEDDKKIIFNLAGFDYLKYKELLKKKPNGIYILGIALGHQLEASQLVALKNICSSTPTYSWFYKPHPNKFDIPTKKILKQLCPNIKSLDAHIPYELLILGSLKPTKVGGMASSLFANQKKDDIIAYIQRGKPDLYLPILQKAELINDENIYSYEKTKKEFKKLGIIRIIPLKDKPYWLIKTAPSVVCKMTVDSCGTIVKETQTEKTIQFHNGYLLKINHKSDYIWEETTLTRGAF